MAISSWKLYIYPVYHPSIAEPPYLVRLVADEQPASVRIAAEIAFAQELERILGGAAEVARACGAVQRGTWDEACALAAGVVTSRLGLEGARFDVQPSQEPVNHRC
jgi:hypothetical protein